MDMARSCYTATMQFDEAGTILVPVQWYFCDDNALPFPDFHAFPSTNWDEVPRQGYGLGEQNDSDFAWVDGAAPFFAPGSGSFCGTVDEFQNGVPSDALPIDYNDNGVPPCCPQPPCQPWVSFGPPARSFKRLLTGEVFHNTLNVVNDFKATSSVHPGDEVQFRHDATIHCGSYDRTVFVDFLVRLGSSSVNVPLTLLSFDLGSATGTWQAAVNPFRYSGELFSFTNPLT